MPAQTSRLAGTKMAKVALAVSSHPRHLLVDCMHQSICRRHLQVELRVYRKPVVSHEVRKAQCNLMSRNTRRNFQNKGSLLDYSQVAAPYLQSLERIHSNIAYDF